MIKIENTKIWGFEHAIRGMRNPMNSWAKSDSQYCTKLADEQCNKINCRFYKYENNNHICKLKNTNIMDNYILGPADLELATKLAKAGTTHRKYLRQIFVSFDLTAPLYFWKEFDTYKVGTVANSTSTMHKIHSKELCLEDFSYEQLTNDDDMFCSIAGIDILLILIDNLNEFREAYIKTGDKTYWYNLIQLLPESYNQTRTITLNYEVLINMYNLRKNHKLQEWRDFCKWIESLPYSELICAN